MEFNGCPFIAIMHSSLPLWTFQHSGRMTHLKLSTLAAHVWMRCMMARLVPNALGMSNRVCKNINTLFKKAFSRIPSRIKLCKQGLTVY